jgi:hypothetical protein
MGVSRNRKGHKKKVQARREQKIARAKKVEGLIEELNKNLRLIKDATPEAVTITGTDTSRVLPAYNININEL